LLFFSQMFGVQPPQTLYLTRHSPRSINRVHSTERPSHHSEREAVLPADRNVIQASYLNRDDGTAKQSRHRASSHSHAHSESIPLLGPSPSPVAGSSSGKRASAVYIHYRYSLNSLSDIINRVSVIIQVHSIQGVTTIGITLTHSWLYYRTTGNPWLSFIQS
jgi:hypothetical protein